MDKSLHLFRSIIPLSQFNLFFHLTRNSLLNPLTVYRYTFKEVS